MTKPYKERSHRRVNWPPGSWHPPDSGSIPSEHPQQPSHPRAGKFMWVHKYAPIHFQEFIL